MSMKQDFQDNIYEGAIKYYKKKMKHTKALDYIVSHLYAIDENPRDVKWIIREGIWMPGNSVDYTMFPDFIIGFGNREAIPIEYKSMRKHKDHALVQLQSGKKFIEDVLGYDVPYCKFVRIVGREYKFEVIK